MRLLRVAAAVFGTAVLTALALTIVDLYLTGHSRPSLGTPIVVVPALGISTSVSDLTMLGAMALAGWIAWRGTRRDRLDG